VADHQHEAESYVVPVGDYDRKYSAGAPAQLKFDTLVPGGSIRRIYKTGPWRARDRGLRKKVSRRIVVWWW
jgi:hypothetical protein